MMKGVVNRLKYPSNGVLVVNGVSEIPSRWDFNDAERCKWIEVLPEWLLGGE